jgi:hypothetical protein
VWACGRVSVCWRRQRTSPLGRRRTPFASSCQDTRPASCVLMNSSCRAAAGLAGRASIAFGRDDDRRGWAAARAISSLPDMGVPISCPRGTGQEEELGGARQEQSSNIRASYGAPRARNPAARGERERGIAHCHFRRLRDSIDGCCHGTRWDSISSAVHLAVVQNVPASAPGPQGVPGKGDWVEKGLQQGACTVQLHGCSRKPV